MYFDFVYETGRKITIFPKIKSLDKKFKQVEFPYTSAEFLSGIFIWFLMLALAGLFFFLLHNSTGNAFFLLASYAFVFASVLLSFSAYIYGASIWYTQGIMQQREEMLQALLEMANYIGLNASLEYAFIETSKGLSGVLGKQFKDIAKKLATKQYKTLGEAFEDYIPVWLEINPDFVKGLTVLQTAALAPLSERETMLREGIKTIIQSYYTMGKRSTERLSNQAKNLISIGVMLPMMSLIMLPMVSIFLPQLINIPLLIFAYNILVPSLLALFAMNFALHRIQVNTIDLSLSPKFKKVPPWLYIACAGIAFLFSMPAIIHFFTMDISTKVGIAREYSFQALFIVWLAVFGVFLAVELFLFIYYKLNERTWKEMREVEDDIPHMLQVITSYLTLNRPMEAIFEDVKSDYIRHGFKKHAVVKIFDEIINALYNTKKTLGEIVDTKIAEIIASKRLLQIFRRLINFAETDIKSAAKAAKMIRSHTLSIFRLDNYIQTLLNDTAATVEVSAKGLAPVLGATAVIMSVAIVMALEYISNLFENLGELFGLSFSLELVDISKIIAPTVIEIIVGLYIVLNLIVLGAFLANVRYGTDRYRMAKTIFNTLLIGFLIYTLLTVFGIYLFTEFVFKGVLLK